MTSPRAPRDRDCPGSLAGTGPTRNTGLGVQFARDDLARRLPGEVPVGPNGPGCEPPRKAPAIPRLRSPRAAAALHRPEPWRNGRRPADCTPRRTLRRLRRAPCPARLPAAPRDDPSCPVRPFHLTSPRLDSMNGTLYLFF